MLDWLENDLLLTISSVELASSDASFRRYFRIKTPEGSYIIMDAPPEKENTASFINVAETLTHYQVNVPTIFHKNRTEGFLLLEDFGSVCFLDALNTDTATDLYHAAFDALYQLQSLTAHQVQGLPEYDMPLLQKELAIFTDWFLQALLDIPVPYQQWDVVCDQLINSALEQPKVCVHRDFHSRNLMVLEHDSPGIIDFQDAVLGPVTYDLVSLLKDCYIAWPAGQVDTWMVSYYNRLLNAKLIDCSLYCFTRWFDLMGLQRHLKAIGIFSRLHLRDGKSNYLPDIPRTLNYVLQVCAFYPELKSFGAFLQQQVLPEFNQVLLSVDTELKAKN